MNKYKCISSFTCDDGHEHRYGDKIDESTYDRLTSSQKRKFQKEDDDVTYGIGKPNIAMGDMLGTGIPGGIDMDFTTPF